MAFDELKMLIKCTTVKEWVRGKNAFDIELCVQKRVCIFEKHVWKPSLNGNVIENLSWWAISLK